MPTSAFLKSGAGGICLGGEGAGALKPGKTQRIPCLTGSYVVLVYFSPLGRVFSMKSRSLARSGTFLTMQFQKVALTRAFFHVHRAHSRVLARLFFPIALTRAFWRDLAGPRGPRGAPGAIRMTPALGPARAPFFAPRGAPKRAGIRTGAARGRPAPNLRQKNT